MFGVSLSASWVHKNDVRYKKNCTLLETFSILYAGGEKDKSTPSITVTISGCHRRALRRWTKILYHVLTGYLNSAISLNSCYFPNFVWKKSPLHGRMSTLFSFLYWFWRLSTQDCFQAFMKGISNTRNLTPEDFGPAVRENKQNRKVIYWQV